MKHTFIVRGAKWGDEGKGHIVEALAEKYGADLIVRDVGGAQAAHHVVLQNGIWHRFQQFGSATFQGVPTLLSRHFVVDPFELEREVEELKSKGVADPYSLMYIHEDALMALPMHKYGDDQWRKANPGISTCGMGIGEARWLRETQRSAVYVHNLNNRYHTAAELTDIQNFYGTDFDVPYMAEQIWEIMRRVKVIDDLDWKMLRDFASCIIFEGAQGALLDAERGDKPYVTSSCTDYSNAWGMLDTYTGTVKHIAVMRSYETIHDGNNPHFRPHGALTENLKEAHNQDNEFQGKWRCARFSMESTRRGLEILKGTDMIAMTHLDRVPLPVGRLEQELGIPIRIRSYGPTKEDVRFIEEV